MIKGARLLVLLCVLVLIGCATVKKDWEKAESINTIEAYQDFLRNHSWQIPTLMFLSFYLPH